jgi:Uma2 family endonuclease
MTVAEYQQTPEVVTPQELIFGHVEVHDAPTVSHQRVVLSLAIALHTYASQHGGEVLIAPTDVVLDERRALVLQSDLLYLAPGSAALAGDRVEGAPDLVIEVLSPYPRIGRLDEKVRWYSSYGVREIWLYHQLAKHLDVLYCAGGGVARSVRFGIGEKDAPIDSAVLPDFQVRLRDVLASRL